MPRKLNLDLVLGELDGFLDEEMDDNPPEELEISQAEALGERPAMEIIRGKDGRISGARRGDEKLEVVRVNGRAVRIEAV